MKKYNLFGIFLLGFLLISTSFCLVAADDDNDDDDDGVDDDYEELNEREIEIKFSDSEFKIESHLTNGDIINEIEFKVKYDAEGLSIEVSYEEEYEGEGPQIATTTFEEDLEDGNSDEFELEFEAKFRKLIEFVDLDDNGMYNESIDQTIQEVELNSFQPISYTTSIVSPDTTLYYIIVNTTDGVFAAHIFFVEEFTLVDQTLVTPTQTKIDIEINNFNFLDSNSQLALYVKLESEIDYEEEEETDDEREGYASDEAGVITKSIGYSGIFTWKENATIDGVVMDVLANTLDVDDDDEIEQKLILNYPRGNHIYHDPKIGVIFGQSSTSNLAIVLTGTVVTIGIIGIAIVILAKKRRIA